MADSEAGPALFRRPLSGNGLIAARVMWLAVVGPTIALAVFGFKVGFADLTLLGPESIFVALNQANINPATSVVVGLVVPLALMITIGAFMFWKRPSDPMALLTSLMLITLTTSLSRSVFAALSITPSLELMVRALVFVGFGTFVLVFALFPNGSSVPARVWMASPLLALVVAALPGLPRVLANFPSRPADFEASTWRLTMAVLIAVFSLMAICQGYRYLSVSNSRERLQAKWVILPLGLIVAHITVLFVLSQPSVNLSKAWEGWGQLSVIPTTLLFPAGVVAAIHKYRLYDIERIVSRTVSYGLLLVLLFSTYAALVFVLRELMPLQGDLAVAGSTLGVAALANPLRRRLKRAVDLRFNRTHVDAARSLSDLTTTLRSAGDLDTVAAELRGAVEQAFQPHRLTVWVRSE